MAQRKPKVPPTPAAPKAQQVETVAVPVPLLAATIEFLNRTPGTYLLLREFEIVGLLAPPQPAEETPA